MGKVFEREIQSVASSGRVVDLSSIHLEPIKSLSYELFPERWSNKDFEYFLNHPCRYTQGIFFDGELVSFLLGLLVSGELDIISIGTSPSTQRRGIANKLIQMAMQDPNIKRIFLEVRDHNVAAINLYTKLGFEQLGTRKKYYEGKTDALQFAWVKTLFSSKSVIKHTASIKPNFIEPREVRK